MSIWTPETAKDLDYFDKVRYLIVWRLSLLFIIIFSLQTFAFSGIHPVALAINSTVLFLSVITTVYMTLTRHFIVAYYVFTISASALVIYSMVELTDALHYTDFLWTVAIVLFSFIGMGRNWAIFFLIIHTVSISHFMLFQLNENQAQLHDLNTTRLVGILIEVLFAVFVITYLFSVYFKYKNYSTEKLLKMNTELEEQNKLIAAQVRENETLLKEVHHRVKNNLQIVTSLLRMQSSELETEAERNSFSEAIGRVMAISLIHKKLYEEKNLSTIRYDHYLNDLIDELKGFLGSDPKINVEFDPEIRDIGLKTIVPLGLLLNELITNSVKHSQADNETVEIVIHFKKATGNAFSLEYSDSGKWIEPQIKQDSFGTELVEALTEQLEGTVVRNNTAYSFHLKSLDD